MLSQTKMSAKKEISFLLQVAIPFLILAYFKNRYFLIPVVFILIGLPFSSVRSKLIHSWQSLGELLGKIVSPIVLSVLYYLGLTPLALIRRIFGKDELNLKKPKDSNLKHVRLKATAESFDDLW